MSDFFDNTRHDQVQKDEMEILDKQKHEFKLIGRQRKVPGHTMFCINLKTGAIKKAPIDHSKAIDFKTREPVYRDRIVIESDCLYRQALNKKNFIKRLIRRVSSLKDNSVCTIQAVKLRYHALSAVAESKRTYK